MRCNRVSLQNALILVVFKVLARTGGNKMLLRRCALRAIGRGSCCFDPLVRGGIASSSLHQSRRHQSNNHDGYDDDLHADLQSEMAKVMSSDNSIDISSFVTSSSDASAAGSGGSKDSVIEITKLVRPPAKFDLLTHSFAYEWRTTAKLARKVIGPMREWASEIKYRTGVHLEMDPTYPEKLLNHAYPTADDVEITVYLFGTDRGVANCKKIMEAAIAQDPIYVRLGVFRRVPSSSGAAEDVEWLTLRRINRENRPPDVPKISLKLPGKYTLLYENFKEAAIRTLWEETGITVASAAAFPSGYLSSNDPNYFWRVPVRYFVAEVPHDVEVLGPQTSKQSYMMGWDSRILRQSPDPIDREWARLANADTGCAWMKSSLLDELQRPLRGERYMATRYTPPPHSNLQDVVQLDKGQPQTQPAS